MAPASERDPAKKGSSSATEIEGTDVQPTPPSPPQPGTSDYNRRTAAIQSRSRSYRVKRICKHSMRQEKDAQSGGSGTSLKPREFKSKCKEDSVDHGSTGEAMANNFAGSMEIFGNQLFEESAPELHESAVKIQSAYREYMLRKSVGEGLSSAGPHGNQSMCAQDQQTKDGDTDDENSVEEDDQEAGHFISEAGSTDGRYPQRDSESSLEGSPECSGAESRLQSQSNGGGKPPLLPPMKPGIPQKVDYEKYATRIQATYRGHKTRGELCASVESRGIFVSSLDNWRAKQKDLLIERQKQRAHLRQQEAPSTGDSKPGSYRKELFNEDSTFGEDVPPHTRPQVYEEEETSPGMRSSNTAEDVQLGSLHNKVDYPVHDKAHECTSWATFYRRQTECYIPYTKSKADHSGSQKGYRIRLLKISYSYQTSSFPFADQEICLRMGLSLWDEKCKKFIGNTIFSPPTGPLNSRQMGTETRIGSDLNFDVFLHTAITDVDLQIVVELIAVEMSQEEVSLKEVSLGFFMLPLFQVVNNQGGIVEDKTQMFRGTPRYLFLDTKEQSRSLHSGAHLQYQVSLHPDFCGVAHNLLPENFMVSYKDIVPGIRRLDGQGRQTTKVNGAFTPLSQPQASPSVDMKMRNIEMRIPWALHLEICGALSRKMPTDKKETSNMAYALRAAPHCGHRVVGPWRWGSQLRAQREESIFQLKLLQDIALDNVPVDELVVVVVEIVASLLQDGEESAIKPKEIHLVSWSAFQPFTGLNVHDGWSVCSGVHELELDNNTLPVSPAPRVSLVGTEDGKLLHPHLSFQLHDTSSNGRNQAKPGDPKKEDQVAQSPCPQEVPRPKEFGKPRNMDNAARRKVPEEAASSHISESNSSVTQPQQPFATPLQAFDIIGKQMDVAEKVAKLDQKVEQLMETLMKTQEVSSHIKHTADVLTEGQMDDLQRFQNLLPDTPGAPSSGFSGGVIKNVTTANQDRALMAQVHALGATEGIPADIQATLRGSPSQLSHKYPIDLALEWEDPRSVNEVVLQFLAVRGADTLHAQGLKTLYFTFQLYNFQPTVTPRSLLQSPTSGPHNVSSLKPLNGRVRGSGLVVKFKVELDRSIAGMTKNPIGAQQKQHRHFSKYLASRSLVIDIWDGDSMLQVGFVTLDLEALMRQGREYTQQYLELPIQPPFVGCTAFPGSVHSDIPLEPRSVLFGNLLMRVINIGRPLNHEDKALVNNASLQNGAPGNVWENQVLPHDHSPICHTMDKEMRKVLRQKHLRKATLKKGDLKEEDHNLQSANVPLREKMFSDIQHARSRKKKETLTAKLRQNLSSSKLLEASYGEIVPFDHEFHNPLPHDEVFILKISHPKMVSVVNSRKEWSSIHGNGLSLEPQQDSTVSFRSDILNGEQLFLVSKETVRVAFQINTACFPEIFQEMCDAAENLGEATQTHQQHFQNVIIELMDPRTKSPTSVLEVTIVPWPAIIDRTFRMHGAEREHIKQIIPVDNSILTHAQETGADSLEVRCSRSDVLTEIIKTPNSPSGYGVSMRCKTGASFSHQKFYVLLYVGGVERSPVQVWMFYVHSWRQVHLQATVGQTSHLNTVIRGGRTTRRVRAFSTRPGEVEVAPSEFVLAESSIRELMLSFRPVEHGKYQARIHIVDAECQDIIDGLVVSTMAELPIVSHTFEVGVAPNTKVVKKISFSNPYQEVRAFHFHCNTGVVQPHPEKLVLPGQGVGCIGLEFDTRGMVPGPKEVILFINDEDDKIEDCYKLKMNVFHL